MRTVKPFDAAEEDDLLQEWFDSVEFDKESEGLPPLAPEEDDEDGEASIDESVADEMKMLTKLITPGGRVGSDRRLGSRRNGENWVERSKAGELPKYVRIVRNGLMKSGHSESRATALAVAAMKRWARGGDNVTPKVQAAAAKALAQWEAMKAGKAADYAADLAYKRS